jgi:hypothetical protein
MNEAERLHLQKLINANNVEDQTPVIRQLKHSKTIRQEIDRLTNLRKDNASLYLTSPDEFDKLCMSKCNFLFKNYTDIFHRVKKNEVDIKLMHHFLNILKKIEDGYLDQHEASYEVGTILKEIYVDSALRKSANIDANTGAEIPRIKGKQISWAQYKRQQLN